MKAGRTENCTQTNQIQNPSPSIPLKHLPIVKTACVRSVFSINLPVFLQVNDPSLLTTIQCLFTSAVLLLESKRLYCSDVNVRAIPQSSELKFIISNLIPKTACLHHTSAFNATQFEDRVWAVVYFTRSNTRTTLRKQYKHFCIPSISLNSYSYTNTSLTQKTCWLHKLHNAEVQRKILLGENSKFNMKLKIRSGRITSLWKTSHFHKIQKLLTAFFIYFQHTVGQST